MPKNAKSSAVKNTPERAAPTPPVERAGQRGPVGHEMQERIVRVAEARFRHYGFAKTTIAEIAEDIGVSTAYIYKFYDSKHAICRAVCADTLAVVDAEIWQAARGKGAADARLKTLLLTLFGASVRLFFNDRKLYDMVEVAIANRWPTIDKHIQELTEAVMFVLIEGRNTHLFENRTSLTDTANAIIDAFVAFSNPMVLDMTMDHDLEHRAMVVADMILRSLRP